MALLPTSFEGLLCRPLLVPYQPNEYDCGVYVCRYAYAIYQLRHLQFTAAETGLYAGEKGKAAKAPLQELVTESVFFAFDVAEILSLRVQNIINVRVRSLLLNHGSKYPTILA